MLSPFVKRRLIAFALPLFCGWFGGCYVPVQPADVAGDAARIVGLADPIAYHGDGGPTDVPDSGASSLSLPDAVRRTLTSSPEIQEAMSRVRASEADARQARLLPNPILDVALRFREGGGSPVVEAGLAADLLSLLLRPGRVNAADQRLRAVAAAALVGALDVLADVQQRYAAAQALDALVVVLEERRNLLGRVTQVARAKLGAGEAASLEVTTLEAQRVELETDVAARQLEQRQARLELARLIGQPSDDASWQLDPWQPTPVRAPLDEPAWLARAMAVRPDLQAQEWEGGRASGRSRDRGRVAVGRNHGGGVGRAR